MEYDKLELLKKEIENSKINEDKNPFAIASVLTLELEIQKTVKILNEFKKSLVYKDRILKALKYYEKIVKEWDKKVAKEGNKTFSDRSEKQWFIDNKEHLKLLQKEAKRMKSAEIKEIKKHIDWARNKNDWMGFGFALQESCISKDAKQEFEEFRKSSNYKSLLKKSLENYQNLVKKWQKEIKSKGENAFGKSKELEKDWYKDKVKILAQLKKEAKHFKL